MNTPTCPTCGTDRYLRYLKFTPANTYVRDFGVTTRTVTDDPVSEFFCRKCDYFNGYSVPAEWEQPDETVSDQDILRDFGAVYMEHGRRTTSEGGGVFKTTL
ncbi:hypothetical protein OG312_10485 [Kocuria rhizophila]|uniref:hypothetical protein n=1 Tax=Kocuria rhizophila TaxID=72000 RepID=UPI002E0F86A5|nr:hypothetical protein OG312_10485 [Kocuria rhizophila]